MRRRGEERRGKEMRRRGGGGTERTGYSLVPGRNVSKIVPNTNYLIPKAIEMNKFDVRI